MQELDDDPQEVLWEPPALEAGEEARDPHVAVQEVQDNVHGYVFLSRAELRVFDHPAMVRLKRVKQLGLCDLVFPTGTHVRREHVLGTLHVAHLMLVNLARNHDGYDGEDSTTFPLDRRPLDRPEQAFTRLAALVHDVGHVPCGHTFEDELGLLGKHDDATRLREVLTREKWDGREVSPTLGEVIDEQYRDLAEATGLGLDASGIVVLLVARDKETVAEVERRDSHDGFRLGVCRDIVGNTICADLLDYLLRDWAHLGKPRHFDTRLLQYIQVRRDRDGPSRLAVDLRTSGNIRTDAISSILELLQSRFRLYEMALYHRTKLNASSMLERAVAEIADAHGDRAEQWLRHLADVLLDSSDEELVGLLRAEARKLLAGRRKGTDEQRRRLEAVDDLLVDLRSRQLFAELMVFPRAALGDPAAVQERFAPAADRPWGEPLSPARNRLVALRNLETDFGLDPLSLGMYCPPPAMSTKVAEVRVRRGEAMKPLERFDRDEGELTERHLTALNGRFRALWRVHFSIKRSELNRRRADGLLRPLQAALELLVLKQKDMAPEERIFQIACQLAPLPSSPWVPHPPSAAAIATRVRALHDRAEAKPDDWYGPDLPTLSTVLKRRADV